MSVGSGSVGRGRVKVSAAGEFTPGAKVLFLSLAERPKTEALGYLDATATAEAAVSCEVGDGFGRDGDFLLES